MWYEIDCMNNYHFYFCFCWIWFET